VIYRPGTTGTDEERTMRAVDEQHYEGMHQYVYADGSLLIFVGPQPSKMGCWRAIEPLERLKEMVEKALELARAKEASSGVL
jgi:hypothetical protein